MPPVPDLTAYEVFDRKKNTTVNTPPSPPSTPKRSRSPKSPPPKRSKESGKKRKKTKRKVKKPKRKKTKRKVKKPKRKTKRKARGLVNEQFDKSLTRKDISPTGNLPPIVHDYETIEFPRGPYEKNQERFPEKIAYDQHVFATRAKLDDDIRERKELRETLDDLLFTKYYGNLKKFTPRQIVEHAEPRLESRRKKTKIIKKFRKKNKSK